MTTNLVDVPQTAPRLEARPAKLGRSWVILGALTAVTGLGYAAGRFTAPLEPSSPAPRQAVLAPVAHTPANEPRPAFVPAVQSQRGQAPDAFDNEGETEPATAVVPESTTGTYYVQVASYKQAADAAQYAATLSARGVSAQTSPDPSGAAWQVVRLGPFESRGDAEKARFKLKLHEREKAYVLPRSNGKYHVQVGSFATQEEADPVAQRLAAQGHATKISRIKMGDRRWYCVRIGPFDAAEEATAYRELVKGIPDSDIAVIPFGPPKR